MWILKFCLLIFVHKIQCMPSNEFSHSLSEGELSMNDVPLSSILSIVPSGYSPHKLSRDKNFELYDLIDKFTESFMNDQDFKNFVSLIKKGYAKKGLTFNIYDDNMRETAIALFRTLKKLDEKGGKQLLEWAAKEINEDLLDYVIRISTLYNVKFFDYKVLPPFISKPNYFLNNEAIQKAAKIKNNNNRFNIDESQVNGYNKIHEDIVVIKSNYSGWNLFTKICESELNYFREDVGLNSYYYGLHLLHPFWMSNFELDEINPGHAEHYYYAHQQLMARYLLEKEHLDHVETESCQHIHIPYLSYDNGLPFPTRFHHHEKLTDGKAFLTTVDIAMKECIARGFIVMDNGTKINITDDNHTALLAKLIRANLDSVKAAKIIRSLYGYGSAEPFMDRYNPAPTALHHPQTALRDPLYWNLIKYILNYFIDYKNAMKPYKLSDYESQEFKIVSAKLVNITTVFTDSYIDINSALENGKYDYKKSEVKYVVKQRRLAHKNFDFSFQIESSSEKDVAVRIFVGPKCGQNCFDEYFRFYQLDMFPLKLNEGLNSFDWSPFASPLASGDYEINLQNGQGKFENYSMFNFPERLLIPRGKEDGLDVTIFVVVTELKDLPIYSFYTPSTASLDEKPLGFPFHRKAIEVNTSANNYRFYNVTIYHESNAENIGSFTSDIC